MLWDSICVVCEAPAQGLCARCRDNLAHPRVDVPDELDSLLAVFSYEGVGETLLKQLKFANRREPLAPLVVAAAPFFPEVDTVVPVPVRAHRRRARGYSLPELLSSAVQRRIRTPRRMSLRRVDAGDQQGRSRADRLATITHTSRPIEGRVLLVDDVVTTGATLISSARALRAAGAREVHGFVLAATPDPKL